MKTIVVPTDFSEVAFQAANYAMDLAAQINADIHLFHVCQLPVVFNEVQLPVDTAEWENKASIRMRQLKNELKAASAGKIHFESEVCVGHFSEELEKYCDRVSPFVVIISTHTHNSIKRVLFGSQTEAALRDISWPLLVIPPHSPYRPVKQIALACDYNDTRAAHIAWQVKQLVQILDSKLYVVYVNTSEKEDYDDALMNQYALLRDLLEEVNPEYDFIGSPRVKTALQDYVAEKKIDLLIVSPAQLKGLDKTLHHDHARQAILHIPVPVMAIREHQTDYQ